MQLEVGQILEGKVTGITNFGAFIDIGNNKSGMVHISEISNKFVKNISDFLSIGQNVKVKIINISEKGEIGLSIKKLDENNTEKFHKFDKGLRENVDKRNSSSKLSNFEWQSSKRKKPSSFEDMLSMFKSTSEEKMSDLKRSTDSRRGNGSRRGFQNKSK